jgi:hypothetical protein
MGIFMFIRGYSTLIASDGPNPEGIPIQKLPNTFRHGTFYDSGFSTSIWRYTDKEFSHRRYYVSFQPTTIGQHMQHQKHTIAEKLSHSLKMVEIPAPKENDPKKVKLV